MEIRVHTDQHRLHTDRQGVQLHSAYHKDGDETDEEHQTTHQTEEVHRLLAELIEEPQGHQIQVSVHETVQTELGGTELTFAVLHHFLADLGEPGVLGQIRDIPVHLGEHLDVLHYLVAVRFQTAVHIVQLDARHVPCGGVEQLRRQVLGQRVVVPFLLPTAHQVESVFGDHAVQLRNLVRRVLHVGIHGDDHIALCRLETVVQRRTLTVVTTETDSTNVLIP